MRAARLVGLLLVVVAASWRAPAARACTTVVVGRKASTDGSIFIARNDDTKNEKITNSLMYHPPREGPAVFRSNVNNATLELPGPGLAYVAAPKNYTALGLDMTGRNDSKEETGVNSAGVSVSATETIFNSKGALAADPYLEDTGLIEDVLASVLLDQATSARQGVELLGQLMADIGAGEGFGVMFADPSEVWYFETASGHHWLAQRVPEDAYFASANQGRFQEVDFTDTDGVLASPGLLDFAISAGLWDPASGEPFNFFTAFHAVTPKDPLFNYNRLCALQQLYGGVDNATCWAQVPYTPTFLPPAAPVGLRQVMAGLRDHYEGTPLDPFSSMNVNATTRPIAVLRTPIAHVTRLLEPSAERPEGLTVINYIAMAFPRLAPFIPIYQGLPGDRLPAALTTAADAPDAGSLFWKARRLQALVFQNWPLLAPNVTAAIAAFEEGTEADRPGMEARYVQALQTSGQAAADAVLAEFTDSVVAEAGAMLDQLLVSSAAALGLSAVPSDADLAQMIHAAEKTYHYASAG